MKAPRRRFLGLLPAAALLGCGFRPLYGAGSPAARMRGRIEVATLDGAAGFALRERLTARLGPAEVPEFRLEVALLFEEEGVAITQRNVTTRFRVLGTAAYRLVPRGAPEAAAPVAAGSVRAFTGYSAPASETASAFATLAAACDAQRRLAQTLAERIVERLALSAEDWIG